MRVQAHLNTKVKGLAFTVRMGYDEVVDLGSDQAVQERLAKAGFGPGRYSNTDYRKDICLCEHVWAFVP